MKQMLLSFLVIMLLAPVAFGQATAARGGRGGATGGAGAGGGGGGAALNLAFFAGQYDIMAQQLTLTDEQKAKLQDRVATMNKEIDAFLANAPAQIAAGRRGARGARAGTQPAPNPAVLKLQDDLQLLINEHQVLINQVLTPDQRLAWESYKLHRVLDPRLQSLNLTDDQKDKVQTLVAAAAQSLADLKDGKPIQTLQGQLFRKIIADVLTDAQLGKFMQGALPVQGTATRNTRTPTPTPAVEPLP